MILTRVLLTFILLVSVIWMFLSGDSPLLVVAVGGVFGTLEVGMAITHKIGLAIILQANLQKGVHTMESRDITGQDLREALRIYHQG